LGPIQMTISFIQTIDGPHQLIQHAQCHYPLTCVWIMIILPGPAMESKSRNQGNPWHLIFMRHTLCRTLQYLLNNDSTWLII
jgi:hypothetical protein